MWQTAFTDKVFIEINATIAFESEKISISFRAWGHAM